MNAKTPKFKIRLGMFVSAGLAIFVVAIFLIGREKNAFSPVFRLSTTFKNVSGLLVGSNIRFSGINVGTVDNIEMKNDSTVQVDMLIRKEFQKFIKSDCIAGIGSSGLIGERVMVITQGSSDSPIPKNGQQILSQEPVEIDGIMANLLITAENAAVISEQVAEIVVNINSGTGTLGRLIQDSSIAEDINRTIINLRKSSKGLKENMDAAKDNFLLRGYFRKQEKAEQKVIDKAANDLQDDVDSVAKDKRNEVKAAAKEAKNKK